MRISRLLTTTFLGGATFLAPLAADSNSFTGFGFGLNLGMNNVGLQSIAGLPDGFQKVKCGLTGQQVGLGIGYGLDLSGAYVGARLGYDMRFLPKADLLKNKNSFKFDIHFGMAIENVALPTLFIGYGMNKMELAKVSDTDTTWTKANLSGLRYGARFDVKVAPQVTVGLGTAWWSGKKTIDDVKYTSYSNETTLSFGYHL